tara:strand:- start:27 stop:488 length:462 start_codon:yes stop_codon:yes gene_type:complete
MNKLTKIMLIIIINLFLNNISIANNLKIVDGDTIILDKLKIRFSGIDAPEIKQICYKNNLKIKCGLNAKKLLINKIGNNIPICINEGKDIYKRTLGECFINGESLSSFLVRKGYAFAYRKYSNKYINDEKFAKTNKFGMWAMSFQYPWDYRKK